MRILMTAPPLADVLSPGGIYKVIREIAKNLSKRGHEVIVLQLNSLNRPNEEYRDGFKIIRVNSKHFYGLSLGMYSYLKKHFNELNPDIVHVHGYHNLLSPEIIYIIRKMNHNVPIIFTPHYDPLNHSTILGKMLGWIHDKTIGKSFLKLPDHIISVSNFEANNLRRMFNVSQERITVIPHGVDFINTKKKRKNKSNITLLYVGYLHEYKGVQYIIKALHELIYSLDFKNIKLRIVGEGPEKRNLLLLSKKLKVDEFIEWIPFLPHEKVLEEMKRVDIFLLLSKSEGYGIVVAEALAMGTPTIVTKGTALEEFTKEPGCFGIDYPPDPKEVAKLILKIVSSDVRVGPFSRKIRTWDKVARDYESMYNLILRRRLGTYEFKEI